MPTGTQIGDKFFTEQQKNDPAYQEQIRQAVVGGGAIKNNLNNGMTSYQSNGFNQVSSQQEQPQFDMNAMNAQLSAAQKASKLAGLQGAYNMSMSNLNQQEAKIDPQAYLDRGQKSTASQLGAKNFAEFMASRNQTNSGMAGQSELTRNMQLQGDIGAIDSQARNAKNDIATNRVNLSNSFNSDIAAANAGIDAESLQRQISLMQQEQSRQDQLNQFQKNYDFNMQQFDYGKSQDLINQTGQLSNGQFTQSGLMNNLNIQQQQAQLAEMQNPNSVTNQMARLGLQTAQLNFAALPAQLKAQAQQIAQQLAQGAIDLKTAQTQLNYLPRQLQAELSQIYAQTNATNRSNQSSGSSSNNSGLKDTTSLESSVNKAIAETNTVVNNSSYNFDDRLTILNNMLKNYSSSAGNEAKYMVDYVTKAIAAVTQQKRNYVNGGRYSGM